MTSSSAVEEFAATVEDGLTLSKRLYFGKDRSVSAAPAPPLSITVANSSKQYLPTAPMVYAVISDPSVVDNPDIPSYQPYVHGRCVPPALIPLQMNKVSLEVECYMDTVFVKVTGRWRVHCVKGSKSCDCRIVVPMGEQGSILGVEVDIPRKSYHTKLITMEEKRGEEKAFTDDVVFLKPNIFLLTVPNVDGGSSLSIKLSWSQKLVCNGDEFSLCVPFNFPEYVTPPANKKIPKREKIELSVYPGHGTEIMGQSISHPLMEQKRVAENLFCLFESDVLIWSCTDFRFSYSVPVNHIVGSVLLQSPSVDDIDQREMFSIHLLSGSQANKKVFARKIVYVIDTSASMQGKPLDATKWALCAALSELSPEDSFSIIAFNTQTNLFSTSLKPATKEAIDIAVQWIAINLFAEDGTNMSLALKMAIEMLSGCRNSLPMIFLITDGAVEDERHICETIKSGLSNMKPISPRINTFGIGVYCNHYFLRMLAMIGQGQYGASYDIDCVESRLPKLISVASSTTLANLTFNKLDELSNIEIHPKSIPDLSSKIPLTIFGRYSGNFPQVLKAKGIIAGMWNYEMDLEVQKTKEMPLERILAMDHIIMLTAQAWLSEDKQLEKKVAKMSICNGIVSEYTSMALFGTIFKKEAESGAKQRKTLSTDGSPSRCESEKDDEPPKPQKIIKVLGNLGTGFGNLEATTENVRPGFEEQKAPEVAEVIVKVASDWCSKAWGYCCCICCVQVCSKVNDQCTMFVTQFCTTLAWFGCFEWCSIKSYNR